MSRRGQRVVLLVAGMVLLALMFWPRGKQTGPPEDWREPPVKQVQERMQIVPPQLGDRYMLGPAGSRVACTVVEVSHTSADGSVTFSTGAKLTAVKEAGVPIVSAGDAYATWFLLRMDADPTRYAVGFYDPYWGEKIAPGTPTAEALDETVCPAWKSPDITVYIQGVLADPGTRVTFLAGQKRDANLCEELVGADIGKVLEYQEDPYGTFVGSVERQGEWATDQNGIARQNLGDGSALRQIYFPCGDGAWAQRATDLMFDGADAPTAYLNSLAVHCLGHSAAVTEGVGVTFNIRGGTINVTASGGPTKAWFAYEDCQDPEYVGGDPPGSYFTNEGSPFSFVGCRDGRWIVWCEDEGAGNNKIWKRQRVEVENAGTVNVNLGSPLVGQDNGDTTHTVVGYVESEPGLPLVGEPLYVGTVQPSETPVPYLDIGGNPVVTDADGGFQFVTGDWISGAINNATWGFQGVWASIPGSGHAQRVVLGACILFTEGGRWWRGSERHNNLRDLPEVLIERTDDNATFGTVSIPGGCRTEYMPRCPAALWELYVDPFYHWTVPTRYTYQVTYGDGSGVPGATVQFGNPDLSQPAYGKLPDPPFLHGKINANILQHKPTNFFKSEYPEPTRVGMETGLRMASLETLWTGTYAQQSQVRYITRQRNICPYCDCAVWREPDDGTYLRGYCCQCRIFGIADAMDAWSYYRTGPMWAGLTMAATHTKIDSNSRRRSVTLNNLYGLAYYLETGPYLTQSGLGQPTDAPRWCAVHVQLGHWTGGAFTQDDTAADIQAEQGWSADVLVQPKVLIYPGQTAAHTTTYEVTVTLNDDSELIFQFTIPEGTKGPLVDDDYGEPILLSTIPKTRCEQWPSPWPGLRLVKSVDAISVVEGDDGNSFILVADVPAVVLTTPPIVNQADTPYALQWGPYVTPNLSMQEHCVSRAILVGDCGLKEDTGHRYFYSGKPWTQRYAVPDSLDTTWANIWIPRLVADRTELIEDYAEQSRTRFAQSLEGRWKDAQALEARHTCVLGTDADGFLYVAGYRDGKQYLMRRKKAYDHPAVRDPFEIGPSHEVTAGLVRDPISWMLMAALQSGGDTTIYLSKSSGATWETKHVIEDLQYPYLYAHDRILWLVGYREGAYQGAGGQLMVGAWRTGSEALPELLSLRAIGGADEGRGAIIRRRDWRITAVAPKVGAWEWEGVSPGIAEYQSFDRGQSWEQVEIHEV